MQCVGVNLESFENKLSILKQYLEGFFYPAHSFLQPQENVLQIGSLCQGDKSQLIIQPNLDDPVE